jgi:uncharacterized OsmC-like protein
MEERIIIKQQRTLETEIWAPDPRDPESMKFRPLVNTQSLSPYGMLLASLGTCTGILIHTSAGNHSLNLDDVELRVLYGRNFREDCDHCMETEKYDEAIEMEISLNGDLTDEQREKLFSIARHCPVNKILKNGIAVHYSIAEALQR